MGRTSGQFPDNRAWERKFYWSDMASFNYCNKAPSTAQAETTERAHFTVLGARRGDQEEDGVIYSDASLHGLGKERILSLHPRVDSLCAHRETQVSLVSWYYLLFIFYSSFFPLPVLCFFFSPSFPNILFSTGSYCVAQASCKLVTLLSSPVPSTGLQVCATKAGHLPG